MKKRSKGPSRRSAQKVACTVSAAALMLGVSQAATIGLKFTVDYCGFNNYVNYVNAPAFGIPMDQWQNLTAMGTGYNACSGTSFFSFNEVIDTTTASGGLHPLPNGSLTVSWSGSSANWSGFRGYDASSPPQPINSGPPVPEAQVYAGFIRDGVNFGPGSSGGNNNQPGYSIEITGLKSLFTNTPYAVELVAAADSMQYLTNAFVIDATLNTTQSVTYPNPQVYGNVGDTAWFRAIGGGLSTGSGAVNTDDLKIIGNRAAHSAGPPAYNFASTISGVIITDKPVITMPPQPVVVCGGDSVKWSGYAVGVPPLAYQWFKNGVAVPGATNTDFSLTNVTSADVANYELVVTNLYGCASSGVTVDTILPTAVNNLVLDSNPAGPLHNALNYGATWAASSTDTHGATHTGVMVFNAQTPSQIVVPAGTNFNSGTGTVMFWMRSAGLFNPTNGPATLFDRLLNGKGVALALNADGTVLLGGQNPPVSSARTVADNNWHHIALTYSATAGDLLLLYIDGTVDSAGTSSGWTWPVAQEIELGLSHDTNAFQAFNGVLADVRVYNRVLADTEISSALSGALVDTSALTLRLNFQTAPIPGAVFKWRCPDAVLEGSANVEGPYVDLPDALSPYATSVASQMKFFRYHGHTPTNIVANPFLM